MTKQLNPEISSPHFNNCEGQPIFISEKWKLSSVKRRKKSFSASTDFLNSPNSASISDLTTNNLRNVINLGLHGRNTSSKTDIISNPCPDSFVHQSGIRLKRLDSKENVRENEVILSEKCPRSIKETIFLTAVYTWKLLQKYIGQHLNIKNLVLLQLSNIQQLTSTVVLFRKILSLNEMFKHKIVVL